MTGVCIPKGLINDLNIQKIILDKDLRLLIRTPEEYLFCKEHYILKGCMTEVESYKNRHADLVFYVDEPISSPEFWKPIDSVWADTVFGELTDRAFNKLSGAICFTAYCKQIDVFGWFRIPIFWRDQLSTLKHMQKTYLNKQPLVWVIAGQTRVVDWAVANKKDVWLYSEEEDVNKLVRELEWL